MRAAIALLIWAVYFVGCSDPDPLSSDKEIPDPAAKLTISVNKAGGYGAYLDAIRDARTARPDEVSDQLVAIVKTNPLLKWEEPDSQSVQVVTWTNWAGYKARVDSTTLLTRDVWVTVVPEVQRFCQEHMLSAGDPTLRLEQLLGLPPQSGKVYFVEMWVEPGDLFRPSPDPEITDHTAGLDFPAGTSPEHRLWIDHLKSISYTVGKGGYPWTRLGYTYDWGHPASKMGLSEFVIGTGAVVTVAGVTSTVQYCQ